MEIKIEHHGVETEQQWQGAGVAGTGFTNVVTGIGNTPYHAACDAQDLFLTQVDHTKITLNEAEVLDAQVRNTPARPDAHETCRAEWLKTRSPHATVGQYMKHHEGCELHHYVTIRWTE